MSTNTTRELQLPAHPHVPLATKPSRQQTLVDKDGIQETTQQGRTIGSLQLAEPLTAKFLSADSGGDELCQ